MSRGREIGIPDVGIVKKKLGTMAADGRCYIRFLDHEAVRSRLSPGRVAGSFPHKPEETTGPWPVAHRDTRY